MITGYEDHLQGAKLIGDTYTKVGVKYISDDNTWEEYEYEQKALACPVVLRSRLACFIHENNIIKGMFG